jgi:dipeptidase
MRIPDDMFAPSCNESIIGEIDLNEKDYFMASSNVKSLAVKYGWWDPNGGAPFRWDVAYFGKRANSLRTWRSLSLVAPSLNLKPGANGYPIPIKPDKKLSILDIRNLYGDFYEGTEFDKTKGMAAGPFGNPWWPPGTPDLQTSIPDATGESIIITQSRDWLPDPIGGVMWVGMGGSGDATVYVPFYAGITKVPTAYTIGVKTRFNWDSAFWTFNLVGNFARLNYTYMMKEIKEAQHALETMQLNRQEGIDEEAYTLYRQNPASATRFLNDYCEKNANQVLDRWRDLTAYLIARWAPSTFPNSLHEPLPLKSWRDALSQKQ